MNHELEILKALAQAHPRKLKKSTLVAEVELAAEGVSKTTIERKLTALESKAQIRIYEGEDVTRLAITTDGLDRVAEAQ